ncbi:sensor histidine kinase [Taibaiella koreensis]|uniref:sensor histidine kinase n=1 Tax=Taibaiella koreensis TaxID=1268548 RepID=UPI0013C32192|nr:histidine kinase [Taibaiella koreensis]
MSVADFRPELWFLLLWCMCPQPVAAQLPGMHQYTMVDGYTATNGYVVQQDPMGYIWLGTGNGALRFDGKRFQRFSDAVRPADQEILSCEFFGKDKVLLVPILNNIAWYRNGEVISERRDPRLSQIRNKEKNSAFTDRFTGNVWLSDGAFFGTLYCFSGAKITRVEGPDPDALIVTVRNNWFVVNDRKNPLRSYNILTRRYRALSDDKGRPLRCKGFLETRLNGQYLFAYDKQWQNLRIYAFLNDSTLTLARTITRPLAGKPWRAYPDSSLRIWINFLSGGIAFLKPEGPSPLLYLMEKKPINYLFVDQQQNIWMSARNNNLYFLSRNHFQNAIRVNERLPGNDIPRCIQGDDSGNIAICYINKASLYIRSNGRIRQYKLNNKFAEGPRSICPIGRNRFLIIEKDMALVDGNRNIVRYFKLAHLTYKDMCPYSKGGLLLASQSDVRYLTPAVLEGKQQVKAPEVIFEGRASAVAAFPGGGILIGTPDGLFVKHTLHAPAQRLTDPDLAHINVTDIVVRGHHEALIGTNANGLFYYDFSNNRAIAIPLPSGREGTLVRRIFRQNDSSYWLSSDRGAIQLQFGRGVVVKYVKTFGFYDGLPSDNITSVDVYRDTAFITTAEGPGILYLRDTASLRMSPPLVYINSVRLKDSIVSQPATLTLGRRQNDLLIALSAISYESFGNIRYFYQLKGFSDEWIETDNPDIRLNGLPPGRYVFRAYAVNAKGVQSEMQATLTLHIVPAFWQTILFKALLILLLLAILYFLVRRSAIKSAGKKYEKARLARRLAELELEAIKAQINPHFIYNCLNSIQYFTYERQYEQSRQYLDLFARLIRLTMQYSRETFLTIQTETGYLDNYLQLEQMRFRERLHYRIEIGDDVDQQRLLPSMMIQPYVENALKHGIAGLKNGGTIIIRFTQEQNGTLLVSIADNGPGPGRTPGRHPYALGLRLSGGRVTTYNQLFGMSITTEVHSGTSGGTIIHIKIPVVSHEYLQL